MRRRWRAHRHSRGRPGTVGPCADRTETRAVKRKKRKKRQWQLQRQGMVAMMAMVAMVAMAVAIALTMAMAMRWLKGFDGAVGELSEMLEWTVW